MVDNIRTKLGVLEDYPLRPFEPAALTKVPFSTRPKVEIYEAAWSSL